MANIGGIVGTVIGWLGYQMGLRTDAADASGSLHAKVKNVADNKIGDSADIRGDNTVMGWLASPIKSVQRGVLTMTKNDSKTATITTVNTAKTIILVNSTSGNDISETDMAIAVGVRAVLTNATTITFDTVNVSYSTVSILVAWQAIEFY